MAAAVQAGVDKELPALGVPQTRAQALAALTVLCQQLPDGPDTPLPTGVTELLPELLADLEGAGDPHCVKAGGTVARAHAHAHTHARTRAQTCDWSARVQASVRARTHARTHTGMHARTCTLSHTHSTCMQASTCAPHAHRHARTHAHTHLLAERVRPLDHAHHPQRRGVEAAGCGGQHAGACVRCARAHACRVCPKCR